LAPFFNIGESYPANSNGIASRLFHLLANLKPLPETIIIQLDNAKVNKSKILFAAFGLFLMRQDVVKNVSFFSRTHSLFLDLSSFHAAGSYAQ
jgi:hypothetical protein